MMKRTREAAREVHRKRHARLHADFDELLADYLAHHPEKRPSTTILVELMEWSSRQTEEPDELVGFAPRAKQREKEPDGERQK